MLKYSVAAAAAAGVLMAAGASAAQPTTYVVSSAPYSSVANSAACPVGDCSAVYTTSHKITGTITFANPLPANLDANTDDLGPMVWDYSINDGQRTFSFNGANDTLNFVRVSTDATGTITAFEFKFDRTNGAPFPVGAANGLKARVASIYISSANNMAAASTNAICTTRGDNSAAALPGACSVENPDTAQGNSNAVANGSPTFMLQPPPPPPIPTLSEWAMILLGVLLAGCAALSLHRRRQTA